MSSFNSPLDESFKRKETIENSWNKLENIFASNKIGERVLPKEIRPKSSDMTKRKNLLHPVHGIRHKSTSRSDNRSPSDRRNTHNESKDYATYRPTSVSITSLYPRAFTSSEKFGNTGLTAYQLHKIYEAKCHDLRIPILLDQERNFFTFCSKHFTNRRFELSESGIGLEAAKAIGEVLSNNNGFAYVELSKNMMGDEGVINLAKFLCKNMFIVHLDVSSNDITPEGASCIISLIANHPSVVSLDLSSNEGLHRNRLGVLGAQAIHNALKATSILAFINVSGTSLGNDGFAYLIDGLRSNQSLVSLDISNNALGPEKLEDLSKALITSNLRSLNLSLSKIGNEGSEYLANLIASGYDGLCPLETLDISKNEITTKGLSRIFSSLRSNSQLFSLNLERNNFSQGLSNNCLPFLSDNNQLKILNLSGCELKTEGVRMLSDGIAKNRGLRSLLLSSNLIDDIGVEGIANGVARNQTLKILDLSNNCIKNRGGIALASAFKINQTLEELNLKENNIKDIAGQLFSEVSRCNTNILKLNLEMNQINFKYLNDIKENTKSNKIIYQKSLVPKLKKKIESMQFD